MNKESLLQLERLNKIQLTESERVEMLSFFERQDKEVGGLDVIQTEDVERMVHVMPMTNVIREDVAKKDFTRDQLQADAPESYDGYWQVPRLVE